MIEYFLKSNEPVHKNCKCKGKYRILEINTYNEFYIYCNKCGEIKLIYNQKSYKCRRTILY